MNGKNLQELISNLQVFYKCPSCGAQYKHEDITFLGRVDEHCFMQLTCNECSLPILATVLLSTQIKKGAKEVIRTSRSTSRVRKNDLSIAEKKYFSSKPPISGAEIADLHLYLTKHLTDIQSLY